MYPIINIMNLLGVRSVRKKLKYAIHFFVNLYPCTELKSEKTHFSQLLCKLKLMDLDFIDFWPQHDIFTVLFKL